MRKAFKVAAIILGAGLWLYAAGAAQAQGTVENSVPLASPAFLSSLFLGLLAPVGIILVLAGSLPADEAPKASLMGLVALCTAILAYFACGFAFQFGGLGLFSSLEGSEGLIREWSPFDIAWGLGWGTVGLDGFFLTGGADHPNMRALFLRYAFLAATATVIPATALYKRVKAPVTLLVVLLVPALVYPLFSNWVWGGGWLSQLGKNLALGHGFVDFGGSAVVFGLGGLVALAGALVALRFSPGESVEPATLPPVHLPILAILGGIFVLTGWLSWMATPLRGTGNMEPSLALVNGLLGAVAGAMTASAYAWFATGEVHPLLGTRGLVAGLVAVSASCPFVPSWAALAIGAIAGLLLPLGIFLVERVARWRDPSAAIATFALSGIWGTLALALFADGRHGAGWNGVGEIDHLGIAGQGVSGYLTAYGYQPDIPGQLYAQVIAVVAMLLFILGLCWIVFRSTKYLFSLFQGARRNEPKRDQKDSHEDSSEEIGA
jgi:Amt family ammonium transporter